MRRVVLVAGLSVGVIGGGTIGAVASSGAPASSSPTGLPTTPLSQGFKDELSSSYREWAKKQPELRKRKRPSASVLRDSASAHRGRKTASEARKQLGELAPGMTTSHSVVPEADDVATPIAANAVRLRGESGKPGGVAVSNMPLSVPPADKSDAKNIKTWKLADLSFESADDRYRVARTYLPISVPKTAGGEVKVDDLAARFAPEGSTSTGSVDGESITYPNVATDTDLTLRSSSVGVKAGWTLRSPDAPSTLQVPLELPDGAVAKVADDYGTVTITNGAGQTIGAISAPSAIDSASFPVGIQTTIDNGAVVYRVEDTEGTTAYPVAIDPTFSKNWEAGVNPGDFDYFNTFAKSRPQVPFGGAGLSDPAYGQFRGLEVYGNSGPATTSTNPNGYATGDFATFAKYAPGNQAMGTQYGARKISPEHAYWYRADLTGIDYSFTASQGYHFSPDPNPTFAFLPYTGNFPGITQKFTLSAGGASYGPYDGGATNFNNNTLAASVQLWTPGAGNVNDPNGAVTSRNVVANRPDNLLVAGLFDRGFYGGNIRPATAVFLGGYTLYASDDVAPTVTTTTSTGPTDWTDDASTVPTSVGVTATDNGTGVLITQMHNSADAVVSTSAFNSCPAIGDKLCEYTQSSTLAIPPVYEGRTTYTIDATDASGSNSTNGLRTTTANRKTLSYGIDTRDPDLTLSNTLFTQAQTETQNNTTPTTPPTGALTVSAADGDPDHPEVDYAHQSGVDRVEIYVNDALVQTYNQTATGDSRGVTQTWQPPAGTFTAGNYDVRVETYDKVGHNKTASFVVHAPCCGSSLGNGSADASNRLYRFGDVDGDSKADLVLIDKTTGALNVRAGAGDGTFGTETSWGTLGASVTAFDVGDMTGDGKADLAARTGSGAIATRLSSGSAFGPAEAGDPDDAQTSWPATRSFNLADVDGDQVADLWGVDTTDNVLYVASGTENGFLGSESWITLPDTRKVDLADVDGDSAADLVSYEPSSGTVNVHLSDGSAFGATQAWGTGPANQEFSTGDINGDGLADAVFRDGASPGTVTAKETSVQGGFISGQRPLGTLSGTFTLQTDDLTGDTKADVVGTRQDGNDLVIRSVASQVPDPDEADPYPVTTPAARQAVTAAASGPRAIAMAQADKNLLSRVSIGLSDGDREASFGTATAPFAEPGNKKGEDAVYRMMRHLRSIGVTRLRAFVWWGQVDRLRPGATSAPALPAGQEAWTTDDHYTDGTVGSGTKVAQRWLWKPYDEFLKLADRAGLSVHFTISGGNRGFTECDRRLPSFLVTGALSPRGCVGSGQGGNTADPNTFKPTGWNPSPSAYDHFVSEAVYHFKSLTNGKNALSSIGLWNEPNLQPNYGSTIGGFLASTSGSLRVDPTKSGGNGALISPTTSGTKSKRQKNTAELYGRLYAAGYHGAQTALSSLSNPSLSIGFGEMSSGRSFYIDGKDATHKGTVYPSEWLDSAMTAATQYWDTYGDNPGNLAVADFFAVHPYQYVNAPWQATGTYPFGVYGVGHSIGTGKRRSVERVLSDAASARNIASSPQTGTNKGSAPDIWATEFGYFTSNASDKKKAHSEATRAKYLKVTGGGGAKQHGAFSQLADTGDVRVINMFQALEGPPPSATTYATGGGEYGYIGSQPQTNDDQRSYYTGQLAKVTGARPYAVANPTGPTRLVACEIRRFERDRGLSMTKSPFAYPTDDTTAWPDGPPAVISDAKCP